MATGGTGDILTGMIAGIMGQHLNDWKRALIAAVWLHGRCGEIAGAKWGEQAMLASDLLEVLPEAMNELRPAV
jgi:NAD(P)H-hydrate epimerase